MRVFLAVATLALLALPAAPQNNPGVNPGVNLGANLGANLGMIEGVVTRSGTSEIVRDAQVILAPRDTNSLLTLTKQTLSAAGASQVILLARTDDNGRFALSNVPPGAYIVHAEQAGFQVGPVVVVNVAAREQVRNVALSLSPTGGSIGGRIVDSGGHSLSGVTISLLQARYQEGRRILASVKSARTNENGEYTLTAANPGAYYISASPHSLAGPPLPGPRAPSTPSNYALTYFPGTLDPAGARSITFVEGSALTADFSLQALPATRISGLLTGIPPQLPFSAVSLYLFPRDARLLDDTSLRSVPNTSAGQSSGQFEVSGVRPGAYDLLGVALDGRRTFVGRTRVNVSGKHVDGLQIALRAGVDITGRVVSTGKTPVPLDAVSVELRPMEALPQIALPGPQAVGASGSGRNSGDGRSFTFSSVPESRYQFVVTGLPDGAYVADIRQGTVSVYDEGLSVDGNPAVHSTEPVQVVVSSAGQTVSGIAKDAAGRPVANAKVTLIPGASRQGNPALYRTSAAGSRGEFKFTGVGPGEYTVLAWDDTLPVGALQDPEFLMKYRDRGAAVNVKPGVTASAEPVLMSGDVKLAR